VITAETAFDESNLSRVGHHNDCFLSSENDMGTYIHQLLGWPLERELEYIGGESRFSPHGGETCTLHDRNKSENAISEMEMLHTDYLNIDWHPDVIQRWIDEGSYHEISRRLGYRFVLRTAELPGEIRPGGLLELQFDIENVGFGELCNPRDVEVTLKNNATGILETAPLQIDPRFWEGGGNEHVQAYLSIPETMTEGTYTIGLWMPDKESPLRNDVRYAIRFANDGVWDAMTGINELFTNLQISKAAAGSIYFGLTEFEQVLDPGSLQRILDSDFDRDGDVDGEDLVTWQCNYGLFSPEGGDADRDGDVDGNDFLIWQYQTGNLPSSELASRAVPELSSWLLISVMTLWLIICRYLLFIKSFKCLIGSAIG
ncbi:MAG: DUF4832 domain-containing protein, partial [Pirellulales bacterium]|nr:DUF4832 domain-containing protein [Pirellulales bacterium]